VGTVYSRLAIVGALVAFGAFALAAGLFVSDTSAATERLGLLFGMFGTIVAALISALRSDAAAVSTSATSNIATALDGAFDARVRNANRTTAAEPVGTPIEPVVIPGDPAASVPTAPAG
jgi:hypothetical protein